MISLCGCMTDDHQREIKEHGSFAFPVACYANDIQTIPVSWHWHDEMEAVVIERGGALIQIASEKYEVTEGNGCFINAGVLHAVEKMPDTVFEEHCIVFHPRLIGGSVDSVFWQKYVLPVVSSRSLPGIFLDHDISWQNEMISHIRRAFESCVKESDSYEIVTRNELSNCMGILLGQQSGADQTLSEKALRQNERMKAMLQFIQQHFYEPVTVCQIAASASISESECMRCFRSTIGMTPITYLKSYRLQYAAELLKNTDLPVAEIGGRCGFFEMSYFSRAFRKVYGCTPSGYRKTVN